MMSYDRYESQPARRIGRASNDKKQEEEEEFAMPVRLDGPDSEDLDLVTAKSGGRSVPSVLHSNYSSYPHPVPVPNPGVPSP
jgi:hypothetical protein